MEEMAALLAQQNIQKASSLTSIKNISNTASPTLT